MFDIRNEKLFPLSRAPKRLPRGTSGKPIHIATVHRWCSSGLKGVRLETVKIGGVRYTSAEALTRFIEHCTDPPSQITKTSTSQARQREISRAERELTEAGI